MPKFHLQGNENVLTAESSLIAWLEVYCVRACERERDGLIYCLDNTEV